MTLPPPLDRRFEAVVFDWDGTAVPDRRADASAVRALVEACCAAGLDLVVVSGTHVANIDGQLSARPEGPGVLRLALNRGSEVFVVDAHGVRLLERREATGEEDAALDRAAELATQRLGERGLTVRLVSSRLNRRKLDLIPEPEWADPPKARIGELLRATEARLHRHGFSGLGKVVGIAEAAARDAGVPAPRVTSDVKHVEIGLTDKSDSARWIAGDLWGRGIAPSQTLICGDELGSLGGVPGSDALLLEPRATAVSVGVEPEGVPDGVIQLGGGPARFVAILEDQLARRRRRDPPSVADEPGWAMSVPAIDPLRERATESVLTLGSGRTGTRGSVAVPIAESDPGLRVAAVYRGAGPDTDLLPGPLWNVLAARAAPRAARRRLDLHAGLLLQELEVEADRLDVVGFASLAQPATMALRASAPHGLLSADQGLKAPGGAGALSDPATVSEPPGSIAAAATESRATGADGQERLERLAGYAWSSDGQADGAVAVERSRHVAAIGYERALYDHRRAWARRWEVSDVRIEGDPELQLGARLAIYHLIGSTPDHGDGAVGARGLTGEAYRGHVFWDAEAFVLPFHAATHPAAARAMLDYRLRRLGAATAQARAGGLAGARFPWESAGDGQDVTPPSGRLPTGETAAIRTGELEAHIVADVAWGASCYAAWSRDDDFRAGAGAELLSATARFWASRIERDAQGGAHIRGVIGPDEYHEAVDDDAYTNVMARWNLRAAAHGDAEVPADERARWLELADALVDGYDPASRVYEQCAGFFGLEPVVIAQVAPSRPVAAPLLLGAEGVARAQVVKQADVLMAHYLVPEETAAGSLLANLDYYEPRTAHGSTLSPGVHAALLARAGRPEQALEWLRLTARIDLDDISGTTAGGVHLAAMGSVWRALTWGFAGLSATASALALDPRPLPAAWRSLEVRVRFQGTPVRVRITPGAVEVAASSPIDLRVAGAPTPVRVGPAGRTFSFEPHEEH